MKLTDQVKNRWTGEVMCGGLTLKVVIENHRKWLFDEEGGERADLRAADLRAADLRAADLRAANLREADLREADLSEANLSAANLRAANLREADLSEANLREADLSEANLRAANLREADLSEANLREADLSEANLSAAPFKIENIHQKIYEAASKPCALDMSKWHHSCGTTHCRAGWAVTLAGDAGKALEWAMGTPAAAAMIYLASDPKLGKMPSFYCDNDSALADMKERAEKEAAQ